VLPTVGDTISLAEVHPELREAMQYGAWVLIVSTSCGACLALDTELDLMNEANACVDTPLVPLLIEAGGPPDSMATILRLHGMGAYISASANNVAAFGVKVVPTLIEVDSRGIVSAARNPGVRGTWPRQPDC
jgi:hypothetical protein